MKLNHYWFKQAKIALKLAWENRNQTMWAFCPICGQDLPSTNSFVSDKGKLDKNKVKYKCSRCGCKSTWNLDIIPGAYLLTHQKLEKKEKEYNGYKNP